MTSSLQGGSARALIAGLGCALGLTLAPAPASAAARAVLEPGALPNVEFHPARGETVALPFALRVPGHVRVQLYTGDGECIRTVKGEGKLAPGAHQLVWDGKDDQGEVVPDEAYHAVFVCDCGGREVRVDARRRSGGVSLDPVKPALSADGAIGFELREPARVLVRVGIKGGALMRSLRSWQPQAPGRTRLEWDGYDASGVERLLGKEGLAVMVTAFTLPSQTVIASGNARAGYVEYRRRRGLGTPTARVEEVALERDGQRLTRQSQVPVSLLRDPRTTLSVAEPLERRADGALTVSGPVTFRVDVPPEDRWLVQQSLYEVSFFLDQQFVSEEETGYTPLSWRWDPAGVSTGRHVVTVNVSGFWGHVGVASLPLWIEQARP